MTINTHCNHTSDQPWEISRRAVEDLRRQRREYALRRAAEEAEEQSQQRR